MALSKLGEKKILWDPNCGNAIAEIGRKKKTVLAIVAMVLPKMEKKKMLRNLWKSKKKVVTSTIFLQHFHNKSQVISYY